MERWNITGGEFLYDTYSSTDLNVICFMDKGKGEHGESAGRNEKEMRDDRRTDRQEQRDGHYSGKGGHGVRSDANKDPNNPKKNNDADEQSEIPRELT